MSLFSGLEVVESLPTLVDEEDLLFGGGEDLFEFLDEEATAENVPAAESREPPSYTMPSFFPFGKREATAPQLKLSGVSSFKKINSRLLQGGALSDREEADAVRELERALGVLGHQKRFLRDHKVCLEKWSSDVYGLRLATEDSAVDDRVNRAAVEADAPRLIEPKQKDPRERPGAGRTRLREVRVNLKCKGADKRRMDKLLFAHVDHTWCLRRSKAVDGNKRSKPCISEKPPKRAKASVAKVEPTVEVGAGSIGDVAEEIAENEEMEDPDAAAADAPDSPGQIWTWLEENSYFSPISRRQPLPEDLTLESEGHLGQSSFIPLRPPGPIPKPQADLGARCDSFESNPDVLRKRLVSALVVPGKVDSTAHRGEGAATPIKPDPGLRWRRLGADAPRVLDVANLSVEQRVLVQLNSVGLIDSTFSSHGQVGSRPTGAHEPGIKKLVRDLGGPERVRVSAMICAGMAAHDLSNLHATRATARVHLFSVQSSNMTWRGGSSA